MPATAAGKPTLKANKTANTREANIPFRKQPHASDRSPSRQLARFDAPWAGPWRAESRYPRTVGDLDGAGVKVRVEPVQMGIIGFLVRIWRDRDPGAHKKHGGIGP